MGFLAPTPTRTTSPAAIPCPRPCAHNQLCLLWFELLAKQLRVLARTVLGLILADNQPVAFLPNAAYPSLLRVRKYGIICLPQLTKTPLCPDSCRVKLRPQRVAAPAPGPGTGRTDKPRVPAPVPVSDCILRYP